MRILISAGEASGDLYASRVVEALRARLPGAEFFGCAGPRMQTAGVRPIIDQRSIAVVGIVEVVAHIPRIWRQFRTLVRAIPAERPDVAVLTDAPDFHLRLAKKLKRAGVPVVYLIAPQAWAWREGRVRTLRATVNRLLCIFPFEEEFFSSRGVPASYIGHPLARIVKPALSRAEFCAQVNVPEDSRIVVLLPGSRHGEVARHIPDLIAAAERIRQAIRGSGDVRFVLALPAGFHAEDTSFWQRVGAASIQRISGQVIEGHTWDALAQAEVALAASGTVTIEAAMLGVPMVTFYRVNALSWILGRWMVRAPFLSMVNLVAGRKIVPELIQRDMTPETIAGEAIRLLQEPAERERMRVDLAEVARKLSSERDPMEIAAEWVERVGNRNHE
ncbi:MAG TPA: lipid-A-disaccharide synthase [Bryobacteraceae bacterium]|nr:lipid-A-disaccharide synthase [Bryobacteraceae bacterium]